MIFVAVTFVCLALLFLLFKTFEDRFRTMIKWQRHTHERLSGLEIKDYAQDLRLDAQQDHIKGQHERINHLRSEVDELGRDVGWTDDNRGTQVLKPKLPPDDTP